MKKTEEWQRDFQVISERIPCKDAGKVVFEREQWDRIDPHLPPQVKDGVFLSALWATVSREQWDRLKAYVVAARLTPPPAPE